MAGRLTMPECLGVFIFCCKDVLICMPSKTQIGSLRLSLKKRTRLTAKGVKFAFMSTTTKKGIAVSYINAKARRPILFEIHVSN